MEYNINELVQDIDFSLLQLEDSGNGLLLTKREMEVLKRYQIPYQECGSLKEILYLIDEVFTEGETPDLEELDLISSSIAERDYYQNTNK